MRRIAFLVTELGPGGAETQVLRLALALKARGHAVDVISMLVPVGFTRELESAGIAWHTLGMRRGHARAQDLACAVGCLRRVGPDVLACFLFHANILGGLAGRLAGVPVILGSIRGQWFGSRLRERLEWAMSQVHLHDAVTTNSRVVAEGLVARGVAQAGRLEVVPNGIDTAAFARPRTPPTALRRDLGVGRRDFLWLAVGNVLPAKDYHTLVQAFAALQAREPRAHLRIAGATTWDGATHAQVQALVKARGLEGRVVFLGARSDVVDLMHAADALVLSSWAEGLPNVLLEAQAAGLPVVATRVGGVEEVVVDGQTGLVVPARDAPALSAAMAALMAMGLVARRAMGGRGQQHVARHFGLEAVVASWEALFEAQLARRGLGPRPAKRGGNP